MSKLDELIQELCPSGVEYKTLDEISTEMYRGTGIKRDQITESGTPCVRYGEIYTTYDIWFDSCVSYTDESNISNKKYFGHGDVLFAITGESVAEIAKSCVYLGHEICLAGGDTVVMKHEQEPKYLAYALSTTNAQMQKSKGKVKSKVVHSSVPALKEIIIPVPTLSIQREIVRLLDNFKELTAELTARKKQYEYYRNELLTFEDGIPMMQLGKIFNIRNGYTPSKKNNEYWENGTVPWFRMEDIRQNGKILDGAIQSVSRKAVKGNLFPKNSIIVATSATVGEHALLTVESLANQRFTYLMLKEEYQDKYIPKFLYYYCFKLDRYCLDCLNQGSFASVDMTKFKRFNFPLVSISKQEHIVAILDRFDKLCNDISEGLPAEIEARRKQYEYYRDKLLTFERKEADV